MDCPHCRAPLPEAASACPACGVDLVKLKAREVLAKLKAASPAPEAGEPPWLRSALFLAALAGGACLLFYGAALIAGRRAAGPVAAVPAEAPQAPAAAVSADPAPRPLPPLGDRRPPPAPEASPNLSVVFFDGSARSQPPPPPPAPPR